MIRPATYYEIICDRCGERLELDGITAWDEESVPAVMSTCDWRKESDGRVICNECKLNDNEE